uniref:Uncharacterized protein n=1 Tax=Cucumis sativus TaxID=3659 RepID=A0A0A0KV33_CUCSA
MKLLTLHSYMVGIHLQSLAKTDRISAEVLCYLTTRSVNIVSLCIEAILLLLFQTSNERAKKEESSLVSGDQGSRSA